MTPATARPWSGQALLLRAMARPVPLDETAAGSGQSDAETTNV